MKLIPEIPESMYWLGKGYENPATVADLFDFWCGDTPWSHYMRRLGDLGGLVLHLCGVPRSKSAIPLCFVLLMPGGDIFPGGSRLKDLKAAVKALEETIL